MLEQIEHHFDGGKSKSRKLMKKFRNKWLRKTKIEDDVPVKYRRGWEY